MQEQNFWPCGVVPKKRPVFRHFHDNGSKKTLWDEKRVLLSAIKMRNFSKREWKIKHMMLKHMITKKIMLLQWYTSNIPVKSLYSVLSKESKKERKINHYTLQFPISSYLWNNTYIQCNMYGTKKKCVSLLTIVAKFRLTPRYISRSFLSFEIKQG